MQPQNSYTFKNDENTGIYTPSEQFTFHNVPKDNLTYEFILDAFRKHPINSSFEPYYNNPEYGNTLLLEHVKSQGQITYRFPKEKITTEMVNHIVNHGVYTHYIKDFLTPDMWVKVVKNHRFRKISELQRSGKFEIYIEFTRLDVQFENLELVQAWLTNNEDIEYLISNKLEKEAKMLGSYKVKELPEKYRSYVDQFVPEHLQEYYKA